MLCRAAASRAPAFSNTLSYTIVIVKCALQNRSGNHGATGPCEGEGDAWLSTHNAVRWARLAKVRAPHALLYQLSSYHTPNPAAGGRGAAADFFRRRARAGRAGGRRRAGRAGGRRLHRPRLEVARVRRAGASIAQAAVPAVAPAKPTRSRVARVCAPTPCIVEHGLWMDQHSKRIEN